MGCDFVTSSCHSIALNEVKGRQHSFCADIPYTTKFLGCTLDYKAVTSCNIMKYSYNLPTQFMVNGNMFYFKFIAFKSTTSFVVKLEDLYQLPIIVLCIM